MEITRALRTLLFCLALAFAPATVVRADDEKPAATDKPLRVGIIGLDTSHVIAFTKAINDPKPHAGLESLKIVAAYPGGSKDLPASWDRVEKYTQQVKEMGVEIVDTIPALLEKVDVVLLESVDGRPHLEQVKPVFEAHKPVFIDKPLAGSLADGIAIAELGKKTGTPWFSSSSLRYSPSIASMAHSKEAGDVLGCVAWSPCEINKTHPDLFWYGIHGVESLFTIMGPGCVSVSRTHTDGTDVATGVWADGRVGTFRGIRKGHADYGAIVFGTKANVPTAGYGGYEPLLVEIAKFLKTGKPPVTPEQTIEILAFMQAADESKAQGGKSVTIESVMEKAKAEAAKKL
jgi:predicted dehydrogenase